jgi:hypothetical protein
LRDHRVWLELFILVNIALLCLDIYLAHSVNQFRHEAEYLPLYFSLAAPLVLLVGLLAGEWLGYRAAWRDLGYLVGWLAVLLGLAGVVLHLDSRFFHEQTIKSLVYAAPFAAPLAYTGLGLLLLVNRMVDAAREEWPKWVLLMALGGFVGNFIFSLMDHAQNGFYHATEWIPVVSSAFAVGFLATPFATPVTRPFLKLCGAVLLIQAGVGLVGFWLHTAANLRGLSPDWRENFIHGAPALAPLLFPNLAVLAGLALWVLRQHVPAGQEQPAALGMLPAATLEAAADGPVPAGDG